MKLKTTCPTTRLAATPSFASGWGRVIDLGGTFDCYNTSESEAEADLKAISDDWIVVGNQLWDALDIDVSDAEWNPIPAEHQKEWTPVPSMRDAATSK